MLLHIFHISNELIPYLQAIFVFAFAVTSIFLPFYIKWLKTIQLGQFIREEGPASHAVKAKTPTTGGVSFILATLVSIVLFYKVDQVWSWLSVAVICSALLCAGLGLSDDLSKFKNRANKGLSARLRLLLEMSLGILFGLLLLYIAPQARYLVCSLNSHSFFVLPVPLFFCLSLFLVPATTNAVNLHDGMDGLAASTTMIIFTSLALMLVAMGDFHLALMAASCSGALLGFLLFNRYPAQIFMGDTGSLFLGGLLAALVLSSGLLLWFIPLSLVYILETISVIIQVSYFKLTKPYTGPKIFRNKLFLACYKLTHKLPGEGKRLLRMSPLHHHFEAVLAERGIAEWQVVLGFWLVQLLVCLIVLAAFFCL